MIPRKTLDTLRTRWWWIVVCALLGGGAGFGLSLTAEPSYTASASVYFSISYGDSAAALSQGSSYTQNQVQSYAALARLPVVLDPVVQELKLDTTGNGLAGVVTATASVDTVIVDIAAVDRSPQQAATIANAVATQLGIQVGKLSPKGADGLPAVDATTVAPAQAPGGPSSPKTNLNVIVGTFGGVFFGVLLVILRQLLDTLIRTAEDIERVTSAPVVGEIARDDSGDVDGLFLTNRPQSQQAEAFRRLRTNLFFLGLDERPMTAVITSSLSGEGKTTTTLNLAIALADSGARVLLIDADLRRPSVAGYLGLEGSVGLTTVLIGRAALNDVIQPWGATGLDIIASGEVPPNPSELLGSAAMFDLLATVNQTYEFILIDSPPLLPVADALVLSQMATGVLLIASFGRVHKQQFADSVDELAKVGSRVLGVVFNRVPRKVNKHTFYGYPSPDSHVAAPQQPTGLSDNTGVVPRDSSPVAVPTGKLAAKTEIEPTSGRF